MKQRIKSEIWKIRPIKTAKRTKNPKNEGNSRGLWNNLKHAKIHIIDKPEGEKREQIIENLFEVIIKKNVPNQDKEIDI